jgi:hypothetical protein
MLRKLPYVILVIILLLALSACSKKPQEGENYFPKTSKGARWEYGIRFSTPAGVKMGGMLISIGDDETINGKTYYKQITLTKGVPGPETHVSYNRRSKEGIYKIDMNAPDKREYLTTPFPLKVGSTWSTETSGGKTQYKAEKLETIELNKTKYENCLKVSVQVDKGMQHFEGVTFFAPGIGEVYSLLILGDTKVDYALTKYKL